MANGRICLSTSFGARGLPNDRDFLAKKGVLVYENAEDFLHLLARILEDPEWTRLSETEAHDYILKHYSRADFQRQVNQLINSPIS